MSKKMSHTRKIAFTAVFVALSVVANIFSIPLNLTGSNTLAFTYLICFLAGIYLGPISGLTVGFLGDLLGHLIAPKAGFYNPYIAVSSALLGLIPALIWLIPKLKKYDKLLLATITCGVVCTAGLNTYGLWWWLSWSLDGFSKTFWVYWIGRVPFQIIMVVVNFILTFIVLDTKILDKILLKGEETYGDSYDKKTVITDFEKQKEGLIDKTDNLDLTENGR